MATGIGFIRVIAEAQKPPESPRHLAVVPAARTTMMYVRCLFHAALVAFVGMMVAAGGASAQPINGHAPWCGTFSQYGGTLDCAYYSLEQCMAGASGVSNQCSRNPWYAGPPDPRQRRRDRRGWRYYD
jgi:Protein of unknown function (DUF3551)